VRSQSQVEIRADEPTGRDGFSLTIAADSAAGAVFAQRLSKGTLATFQGPVGPLVVRRDKTLLMGSVWSAQGSEGTRFPTSFRRFTRVAVIADPTVASPVDSCTEIIPGIILCYPIHYQRLDWLRKHWIKSLFLHHGWGTFHSVLDERLSSPSTRLCKVVWFILLNCVAHARANAARNFLGWESSFLFFVFVNRETMTGNVDIADELEDETGFRARYVPLCLVSSRIALGREIHGRSSQVSPWDRYEPAEKERWEGANESRETF